MSTHWTADRAVDYPYVKDAIDVAAFNLYARGGFLPPTRPNGFLDSAEEASWERWRNKVSMGAQT